ncbi:kinase-like domain-containing protein, partial [Cantharellus anzutake]|uniref:kinase-like domain-containing protein n=1 Tax=Cantharellus anzutake TaxID=1750568 RepID=UPI0019074562
RFAVKALLRTSDHRTRLLQENEVRLHNRASGHPSILTLYHVVDEGLFTYMVMELCPYGDLFRVIESEFFSNNVRAIKSTYGQLLDALVHCHSLGIYHRDIKPENILVKCYEDECPKIVLADFGLATEDLKDSGAIGSELYMSPECLGLYGKAMPDYACAANDVWSMGVILSLLIFGPNVPWSMASDQCEHFAAYCNNIDWYFIEYFNVTVEANHLLTATFRLNPYQRITINALQADFHLVDQF